MKITKSARNAGKQLYRLCLVDGLLDEGRVRDVVQRVIATSQRNVPAILQHFLRLVQLDYARHTAIVQSATPLTAGVQEVIQAGVTRHYGPGIAMVFAQRPELIGGLRLQVGCDVIDGTVRAKLEALKNSF